MDVTCIKNKIHSQSCAKHSFSAKEGTKFMSMSALIKNVLLFQN